jgi:hypothetical protein
MTAGQDAVGQLNAADLSPGEMRDVLMFVAGASPAALITALALVRHRREAGAPVTEAEMEAEANVILAAAAAFVTRKDTP